MNKLLNLFACLALLGGVTGCEDETDEISKTVTVSYPKITLKDGEFTSIPVGGQFTDPGAVLTDDISGAQSDIEAAESDIDVTKPGLYFVTYSAANANGFETTVQRPVAVTSVDSAIDLSGIYNRAATDVEITVKKVANGLYVIDNVGGVAPPSDAVLPVYMVHTSPTEISIPPQLVPNGYGTLDCTGEKLTETTLSWSVKNTGFGTATRTFEKKEVQ